MPDCERQAETLRMRGHEVIVEPLLQIEYLDVGRLKLKGVQAFIATSRNGLRALARNEALAKAKRRPLFTVGEATATMARALGFLKIHTGQDTAEALIPLIAEKCTAARGAVMHLAGERLAFDLKSALEARGLNVLQPALYRAAPAHALGEETRKALGDATLQGVVLMSPATARCWAGLATKAGLNRSVSALHHYCLSDAVAKEIEGLDPVRISVADVPREDELLALMARDAAH